jgi:hypothetical protein
VTTFVPVTIWHNEYADDQRVHWDGFDPAHNAMTPVFTFAYPCDDIENDTFVLAAARAIWVVFDADVDMLRWGPDRAIAAQYRSLRLRSLSGGDITQIGPRYFACELPGGHREVQAADLTVAPSRWLGDWLPESAPEAIAEVARFVAAGQ